MKSSEFVSKTVDRFPLKNRALKTKTLSELNHTGCWVSDATNDATEFTTVEEPNKDGRDSAFKC